MSDELLAVTRVSKRLGHRSVLQQAALSVRCGEVCALVGPNGSGKSTLLRIVSGVLAPDAREIIVGGASLRRERLRALSSLGYAPEQADIPESMRASEWLALIAALKRAPRLDREAARPLDIDAFVHQRVSSLSFGQRRRVTLAAALVGAPRLLVLDEPTNGLDLAALAAVETIFHAQTQRGGAVLFATHDDAFASRVMARSLSVHSLTHA